MTLVAGSHFQEEIKLWPIIECNITIVDIRSCLIKSLGIAALLRKVIRKQHGRSVLNNSFMTEIARSRTPAHSAHMTDILRPYSERRQLWDVTVIFHDLFLRTEHP
jgi:hypothetical protein